MKKRNFTLVELLAVTALVVILAGIGFAAYSYASNRGKEAATKTLITRIAAGLESVKTKHGVYPSSAAYGNITVTVNGSSGLITGISFGGTALSAAQLKEFLTAADGENLKKHLKPDSGSNYFVADAWGGNIQYRYPGAINTVKFDLVAPGPDEGFGTAAAATPPAVLSSYKTNGEWGCDDIANFQ